MPTFERPSWLKNLQAEAVTQAERLGLPNRRDENWRYTQLDQWLKTKPNASTDAGMAQVPNALTEARVGLAAPSAPLSVVEYVGSLVETAHAVLFFADGEYQESRSKQSTQDFLSVTSLHAGFKSFSDQDWFRQMVVRSPNANLKGLGWTAQAHIDEGCVVRILANTREERKAAPLKVAVVHFHSRVTINTSEPVVTKNIYYAESESHAEIFEVHILDAGAAGEIYNFSDVHVASNGHLKLGQYVLGLPGTTACLMNDTQAVIDKNAQLSILNVTAYGHLSRHEYAIGLREEGANVALNSLTLGAGLSHVVNSSLVTHEKGSTTSDQNAKSVLRDSSQFVFLGRLVIAEDAQKSDAKQYNHNLLLSDNAEANSRPQLEVLADDVKAAHGATFGSVNEDEIFYLQSRGLNREAAVQMLLEGHTKDFLDKIDSDFIRSAIIRALPERGWT